MNLPCSWGMRRACCGTYSADRKRLFRANSRPPMECTMKTAEDGGTHRNSNSQGLCAAVTSATAKP
jgi:hypothetical protein